MKLLKSFGIVVFAAAILFSAVSCDKLVDLEQPQINTLDFDGNVLSATVKKDYTTIDGTKISSNAMGFYTYSLSDFNGKTVKIDFSVDMAVKNSGSKDANLMWQVAQESTYPVIASKTFSRGSTNWTTVSGSKELTLGKDNTFYLSTYQLNSSDLNIQLRNFTLTITEVSNFSDADETISGAKPASSWQLWGYSLNDYRGKNVSVDFSLDIAVENNNKDGVRMLWQLNTDDYPILAEKTFAAGTTEWTSIKGSISSVTLSNYPSLYMPALSDSVKNGVTVYIKNVKVNVGAPGATTTTPEVTTPEPEPTPTPTPEPEPTPAPTPTPTPTPDASVTTIDGSDSSISWAFYTHDLSAYNGKTVTISFSADMKVENYSSKSANLMWQVTTDSYDLIASQEFGRGTSDWVKVTGSKQVTLGSGTQLYLSTYQLTTSDFKIYLKNVDVSVSGGSSSNGNNNNSNNSSANTPAFTAGSNWLNAPSLVNAYAGIFDHVGLSVMLNELQDANVRKGLKYHANSFTMGNEMKPQWIQWNYGSVSHNSYFTASNGKTISVPTLSTNDPEHGLGVIGTCLQYAKEMGIQMRGHVLTWHSQTFDWFFCKNYDVNQGLVTDKDEMTARHEWYIKTVLEYVANWEKTNNGGKHIIYTWDVVNEAVADDANSYNYYRGTTSSTQNPARIGGGCNSNGDSRWWQIYKSDEYIINAFRFANKYAPKDVTLCYNDYNEYMGDKHNGDVKLLQAVLAHKNDSYLPTRLDAMGMQSHVENWTSISTYENAIKDFLSLGIDIQITELDFKWNDSTRNGNFQSLEALYESYFKLFQRYAKSNRGTNGITSVTIWGINDETTWLNDNGGYYSPLLFKKSNGTIVTKSALGSVLNAAGKTY